MAKGGKAKALQNGRSLGMSLHKFATAKRSKYDKRARLEKKAALNAGRINKYRKLKQRLLAAGQTAQSAVEHEGHTEDIDDTRRAHLRQASFTHSGRMEAGCPPMISATCNLPFAKVLVAKLVDICSAGPPPDEMEESDRESVGEASSSDSHANDTSDTVPVEEIPKAGVANDSPATDVNEQIKGRRKRSSKPPSQLQRLAAKLATEKTTKLKEKAEKAKEIEKRQREIEMVEKDRKKQRQLFLKKTKRGQPVMKHRIDQLLSKLQ